MTSLTGEYILLRALEPSDIDLIYEWENDPDHWFVSNTKTPFSKHIIGKYIENANLDIYQTRQLRLIIQLRQNKTNAGQAIGTIDLFDFDPFHQRAGIGILIARKEYRSKGYATEALDLFLNYAFKTLNLHQVYCNIAADNQQSINLFKNQGFQVIGEKKEWLKNLNHWINEYMLQKINPDH